MPRPPEAKSKVRQAAAAVLHRDGAAQLTLDAVAREAGVSKGGLLYHYPSKDALLTDVLDRFLQEAEADIGRRESQDAAGTGRFARAYLGSTLDTPPEQPGASALLAAISLNPALLEGVRARYHAWQARAEHDGLPPGLGTLLRLAADGLWLAELFSLAPPTPEERASLNSTVERLTRGAP